MDEVWGVVCSEFVDWEDEGDDKIIWACENGLMARVRKINLGGSKVTAAGVEKVVKCCPDLQALSLEYCEELDASVGVALRGAGQLRELNVSMSEFSANALQLASGDEGLQTLPRLHTLLLSDARVVSHGQVGDCISRWPSLEVLGLNGLATIFDKDIIAIATNCPRLRSIGLNQTAVTDVGIQALGTWCPHLEAVSLHHTEVGDEGLAQLAAGCKMLEELYASKTEKEITDYSLLALGANCPNLRLLDFDESSISDRGLEWLALKCSLIKELDLNLCRRISNIGVMHLRSLSSLEVLDLRGTQVGDEGILGLLGGPAGGASMRELNLTSTLITDKVLDVMTSMVLPKLHSLYLSHTSVSFEKVQQFLESRKPCLQNIGFCSTDMDQNTSFLALNNTFPELAFVYFHDRNGDDGTSMSSSSDEEFGGLLEEDENMELL